MMRFLHLLLNLCIVAHGTSVDIDARDNCHDHFSSCSPQGASSASIPAVGAALSSLYIDLLKSINDVKKGKRGNRATVHHLNARSSPSGLCCELFGCGPAPSALE